MTRVFVSRHVYVYFFRDAVDRLRRCLRNTVFQSWTDNAANAALSIIFNSGYPARTLYISSVNGKILMPNIGQNQLWIYSRTSRRLMTSVFFFWAWLKKRAVMNNRIQVPWDHFRSLVEDYHMSRHHVAFHESCIACIFLVVLFIDLRCVNLASAIDRICRPAWIRVAEIPELPRYFIRS